MSRSCRGGSLKMKGEGFSSSHVSLIYFDFSSPIRLKFGWSTGQNTPLCPADICLRIIDTVILTAKF